jgi:CubicO group peptidase (beta-lactamase class C family)
MIPRVMVMIVLLLASPLPAMDFSQADALIDAAVARGEIPGAVLLCASDNRVVHHKAYGHRAVRPEAEPMTTDTVFDLASLTKPIATATSVMILIERGKVGLRDSIAKYLPQFGQNGKDKITVEQLLLHRGGLIADNPMSDYQNGREQALAKIFALGTRSEPGTRFIYTDVGFIVLGELVAAVDGRPLDRFAREEIFLPLGMSQTTFLPDQRLISRCAPTEQRDGRWMRGDVHDPRAFAMGGVAGHAGLFGTADDVSRFCQMFTGGNSVLKPQTIRQMTTLQELPDGTGGRGYGLDITSSFSGVRGERFERGTTFGHTGFTGTMFWIDPANRCYFVLLTNRVHPDGKGVVAELRKQVATEVARQMLQSNGLSTRPRLGR